MRDTCLRFLATNKVFFFLFCFFVCVCAFSRIWRGTFSKDVIIVPYSYFATSILEFILINIVYASIKLRKYVGNKLSKVFCNIVES